MRPRLALVAVPVRAMLLSAGVQSFFDLRSELQRLVASE